MARILAGFLAIFLMPTVVYAQLDCIVPTREEGYDASRPGAEAVRQAARSIEAIVKKNAVFMNGNEPVRVRTSISYHGDDWTAASVITTAYNRKAWTGSGCQLSQFADRGGGLADGQIAVYINDPDVMLGGTIGDGQLRARLAPRRIGDLDGRPLYGRGDDAADTMVMMSSSDQMPWTPVTIAEALDWREREIAQREAEWQKQSASLGRGEAQLRAVYESMIKADPANAEKMRARMEKDLAKIRSDEARAHSQSNDAIARTRTAFDSYRASFSADQLRGPATISGETYLNVIQRVDAANGRPIVQVNLASARRDARRVHLLVIPQYSVATDEDHEWQVASRRALDYQALEGLLAK